MAKEFIAQFYGLAFTVGQQLIFKFEDKEVLSKCFKVQ